VEPSEEEKAAAETITKVFEWSMAECALEKERLSKQGVSAIDLPVVDMSVLIQGSKKQLNRVVFDSQLDFSIVTEILISEPKPVPMKVGFQYVNVIMFAKSKSTETPLLFPYVFKTRLRKSGGKNNLKHWVLVNNKFEEAYHLIKSFN